MEHGYLHQPLRPLPNTQRAYFMLEIHDFSIRIRSNGIAFNWTLVDSNFFHTQTRNQLRSCFINEPITYDNEVAIGGRFILHTQLVNVEMKRLALCKIVKHVRSLCSSSSTVFFNLFQFAEPLENFLSLGGT